MLGKDFSEMNLTERAIYRVVSVVIAVIVIVVVALFGIGMVIAYGLKLFFVDVLFNKLLKPVGEVVFGIGEAVFLCIALLALAGAIVIRVLVIEPLKILLRRTSTPTISTLCF